MSQCIDLLSLIQQYSIVKKIIKYSKIHDIFNLCITNNNFLLELRPLIFKKFHPWEITSLFLVNQNEESNKSILINVVKDLFISQKGLNVMFGINDDNEWVFTVSDISGNVNRYFIGLVSEIGEKVSAFLDQTKNIHIVPKKFASTKKDIIFVHLVTSDQVIFVDLTNVSEPIIFVKPTNYSFYKSYNFLRVVDVFATFFQFTFSSDIDSKYKSIFMPLLFTYFSDCDHATSIRSFDSNDDWICIHSHIRESDVVISSTDIVQISEQIIVSKTRFPKFRKLGDKMEPVFTGFSDCVLFNKSIVINDNFFITITKLHHLLIWDLKLNILKLFDEKEFSENEDFGFLCKNEIKGLRYLGNNVICLLTSNVSDQFVIKIGEGGIQKFNNFKIIEKDFKTLSYFDDKPCVYFSFCEKQIKTVDLGNLF